MVIHVYTVDYSAVHFLGEIHKIHYNVNTI